MSSSSRGNRTDLEFYLELLLEASAPEELEAALTGLIVHGESAARALTRRVRRLSVPAQRIAIQLAESIGGRAGLVLLEQLLQLGDESLELQILYALGNLDEPDVVRVLLSWLGSSAAGEQLEAILLSLATLTTSREPARWKLALSGVDDALLTVALEALDEPAEERGLAAELVALRRAIETELERRRLRTFGTLLDPDADALGRAWQRRHLVQAIEERLAGSGNRSLILVGPAGAGKTALVHELCHRLGPDGVADRILQTSTGLLLVGTRFLGEWQTRVRELLEITSNNPRLVVYITDVNNLLGAGTTAHSEENIADFLAPYIQQGSLVLIGECTGEELRRGIEQRPAFRRLFEVVRVEGALIGEAREITIQAGQALARQAHGWLGRRLEYSESFFGRLMEIADQFRSSIARPGRSIDLLRATVTRVAREAAVQATAGGTNGHAEPLVLEPHHIVETLARESGVPRALLDDREQLDLGDVRQFLAERVIGQAEAVDAVVDLVTLIKAGLTDPGQPTGVLFFVGPTGVGKTELAKALAEYLFGSPDRMIRLDMSEFTELSSVERLIGSPVAPEWSPHRQGLLTGRIRQQPMSVVLLDEFEKAHRAVFDLLLQVMDDGRLTDVAGRVAHFTQAIIIMTSNLGGAELVERGIGFAQPVRRVSDEVYRRELERVFRPEFINRIDRIVPFSPLDDEAMERIVRREVGRVLLRSGLVRRNIAVDVAPSVVDLLLEKGFDPRYGARPLKREVERRVLLPLARAIVEMGPRGEQSLLRLIARGDEVQVDAMRAESTPAVASVARAAAAAKAAHAAAAAASADASVEVSRAPRHERSVERMVAEAEALRQRVRELETLALDVGLAERKSRLVDASTRPTFWDDAGVARRTLAEIHWIERILGGIERVRKRSDDLVHFAGASGPRPDERLVRAQERHDEISADASLLGMALRCRSGELRQDAFVRVERIDRIERAERTERTLQERGSESMLERSAPEHFEPDPVTALMRMYVEWARRHRYQVDVVDEQQVAPGVLSAGTLLIEGLCPFGILRQETGVHRLVRWEEPSAHRDGHRLSKSTAFCRVQVLPVIDAAEPRISRADVTIVAEPARDEGVLVARHATRLTMQHRASELEVVMVSDKDQEDAEDVASEFLRSLLVLRETSSPPHPGLEPGAKPVRTYNLGPKSSVRDDVTGVRVERVDAVFAGALEAFLEARMESAQSGVISGNGGASASPRAR